MNSVIVCHRCEKLLRDADGVNLVADIYGDPNGEDLCQECHTKFVEPYLIIDDDGNFVSCHHGNCGQIEVEYIEPQPELVSDLSLGLEDIYIWWLYCDDIYRTDVMQQVLLESADSSRTGGPVVIGNVWYWSPEFDRDYTGPGAWSLYMLQ